MLDGDDCELVVQLGDLHAGSIWSPCPPNWTRPSDGCGVDGNLITRWMWDTWRQCTDDILRWADGVPFALVLMGDLVQGTRWGEVLSSEMPDQVELALGLIRPLATAAHWRFVIYGTEVHVQSEEAGIATAIAAIPDGECPAWRRLPITVHGCACSFQHHIGVSARAWTALMIQYMSDEQLTAVRCGWPLPRLVGRAHAHRGGYLSTGDGAIAVSPGWQAKTRHALKVVPGAISVPGVVLHDWRGLARGSLPRTDIRLYPPDAPTGIVI